MKTSPNKEGMVGLEALIEEQQVPKVLLGLAVQP